MKLKRDNIEESIEYVMELIDRMKKTSNKDWKNIIKLKQKILFKLANKDYSQTQTRILVAKLIVQTITALRSNDRINAINRLINKSDRSLLLLAYVFRDLLNLDESIEDESFCDYLAKRIDSYSSEVVVFDLLQVYCQKSVNQHEKVLELLQNKDNQYSLPVKQTNKLLLILKLFPESSTIVEKAYKNLVKKALVFFESSDENNNE
ncbi:unnamed protein product [Rotaria magnacalcarata]|uniref:Uncharacterized protein n=2 Tax=Rotaria magnacalcarata TaxID=392030 RepID=A0A816FK12_9BILA|nr:unnamed protein product [Rotaria magnacalcarata]CAF4241709.1 unnamed protein product [Rotaria magnacalcarata]CAF5106082.1 unnamed protein product [Rotaria magnacalcarata]